MSVILSMELLITGATKDVKEFWMRLNPKDEALSEKHLLQLLSRKVTDYEEYFDGYEVQKKKRGKELSITWSGGFGGFDQGYLGTSFRDDGIELSELFPRLDFTLYYDSHGAEFAGGYGSEDCLDSDTLMIVYAGGVRYRAGVRIGEKTLTEDDYFLQDDEADDEEWFAEPDYDNNRRKIDEAIERGDLRPSTINYRNKWEKKWLSSELTPSLKLAADMDLYIADGLVLHREFWKQVPLIHTHPENINEKIADSAIKQCIYSVAFIPEHLLNRGSTPEKIREKRILQIFLSEVSPEWEEIYLRDMFPRLALSLLLLIGYSPFVVGLIRENSDKFPEKSDLSGSIHRSLLYLSSCIPESAPLIVKFQEAVTLKDRKHFAQTMVDLIRFWCRPVFDEDDES